MLRPFNLPEVSQTATSTHEVSLLLLHAARPPPHLFVLDLSPFGGFAQVSSLTNCQFPFTMSKFHLTPASLLGEAGLALSSPVRHIL